MTIKIPVNVKNEAFECPTCGYPSQQHRYSCFVKRFGQIAGEGQHLENPLTNKHNSPTLRGMMGHVTCTECEVCGFIALWINGSQIFPYSSKEVAKPNKDMPEDIKELYVEAADIFLISPRSSAALLRLCLEKLLIKLEIKGDDLNKKIGNSNFPEKVLKAADAVRLFGNDAVHPGEIRFDEDKTIIPALFLLINYLVETQISNPNLAEDIYNKLTDNQKEQVKRRDKKNGNHEK